MAVILVEFTWISYKTRVWNSSFFIYRHILFYSWFIRHKSTEECKCAAAPGMPKPWTDV